MLTSLTKDLQQSKMKTPALRLDGLVLLLITFVVPGIKSISPSKYLVPVPSWTRTFYAAGTSILHTMTKYVDAERIFIKGPTTEKLYGIVGLKILRY